MADDPMQAIRRALSLARERGFQEVELRIGGVEFEAKLGSGSPRLPGDVGSAGPIEEPLASADSGILTIASPCVGYFENGRAPLEAGAHLKEGEVIATVSALGLANDVVCPADGEIAEVFAQPGAALEFGQPIATLKVEA